MTESKRPLIRVAAIAATLLVCLAACGDDEDGTAPDSAGQSEQPSSPTTSDSPGEAESSTGADCSAVIPAALLEGLGWAAGDPATEDRGGCVWAGPEGTIYVQQSADTFEQACARLRKAAEDTTFRAKVDNPLQAPACGYVRTTELGLSELGVDLDGQVVSINVGALEPTDPERVRSALLALTETAANVS